MFEDVTVTNITHNGTAFGVDHSTGADCLIPRRVMESISPQVGETVQAILVANPNEEWRDRVPRMVRYIKVAEGPSQLAQEVIAKLGVQKDPKPEPEPEPEIDISQQARDLLERGGVWTHQQMLVAIVEDASATYLTHPKEYGKIGAMIKAMHKNGECARLSLRHKADQSRSGRDWYTCFPALVTPTIGGQDNG